MIGVLADYLGIYTKYQTHIFLTKIQKKTRHSELMEWTKKDYQSLPDSDEVIAFMKTNNDLKYETPFINKVVVPCVLQDINASKIKSIQFLFECNGRDDERTGTNRDYIFMFCLATDFQYNPMGLADLVLLHEPENEIVLYYKYYHIKRILEYSIHEVPCGVLCGVNGAEEEDLVYMNADLNTFTLLSKTLCKNDGCLIKECATMYSACEQYLHNSANYECFEDYLIKQKISYGE